MEMEGTPRIVLGEPQMDKRDPAPLSGTFVDIATQRHSRRSTMLNDNRLVIDLRQHGPTAK